MKRTFRFDEKTQKMVEITPVETLRVFNVCDDIKQFQSPDGAVIEGRAQWREHLKRTDSVEMGHSDMKAMERNQSKRRAAFDARLNRKDKYVNPADIRMAEAPSLDTPGENSRVHQEVANRLHGRPRPDRTTLIKIALEEARRHR